MCFYGSTDLETATIQVFLCPSDSLTHDDCTNQKLQGAPDRPNSVSDVLRPTDQKLVRPIKSS